MIFTDFPSLHYDNALTALPILTAIPSPIPSSLTAISSMQFHQSGVICIGIFFAEGGVICLLE